MRALRNTAIACLLFGLFAGALSSPAFASTAGFHGMNVQSLFDLPQSQWDRHLSTLSGAGVKVVRRDAYWGDAEPVAPVAGQHSYDWTRFDRQVEALARHGIRWLPIIDYSNDWAGVVHGDPFTPPARTSDYVAYATALARRYGPDGHFWRARPSLPQLPVTSYEVWNEPNAKMFWHPQDTAPERYAELYEATRAGLKAVIPSARVIVAGLALENRDVMSEHEFVDRMYRHRPGLRGQVDAFALHPYAPTVDGVHDRIRDFRRTLARHGAGHVPLEITEVGWTTTTASEQHRAESLARLARELPRSDCGVTSVMPHTWLTGETDRSNSEHWFGVANSDGSLKPSGAAYLDAVRSAGAGPRLTICGAAAHGAGSAAATGGPGLRLKLKGSRRSRRLTVIARCPRGCRLRLGLYKRRGGGSAASGRAIARRSVSLSSRRRVMSLRMRPGRRALVLRAVATRGRGASTTRVRNLTVRCRKSSRSRRWSCAVRR